MIKLFFSRVILLFLAALVLHAFTIMSALIPDKNATSADGVDYSSPSSAPLARRDFDAIQFANVFNIKPFVQPEVVAAPQNSPQDILAEQLKLLAVTFNGTEFQAVVAVQQRDKSDIKTVKVDDTVADFKVTEITKFQILLTTNKNELVQLDLFKSVANAQRLSQIKEN
ncbi:hypothetical protein [Rheinheimera baltica]|uniref:hypothetical protein n=1 Tax=Rheinheimera baltica TaxID=67576 RepID=UPI0004003B5A|nr:hypothetical protein [Rheinheimera baltica]MDP5143105.1 hypothetical protein [Rheinheimera baltica]MDP5189395.1 hypothetical protein [Rheinheimera baltica]